MGKENRGRLPAMQDRLRVRRPQVEKENMIQDLKESYT